MARVVYSADALADLDRIIDLLLSTSPDAAAAALAQIEGAVGILAAHPRIGRRALAQLRELVISHGASGYVALYRHEPALDLVRIVRIRHQREAGYRD